MKYHEIQAHLANLEPKYAQLPEAIRDVTEACRLRLKELLAIQHRALRLPPPQARGSP